MRLEGIGKTYHAMISDIPDEKMLNA